MYVYHIAHISSHRNEYFHISCRKDGSFAFENMPPKHKCLTQFFYEGRRKIHEWEVLNGEEFNYCELNFNVTLSNTKGSKAARFGRDLCWDFVVNCTIHFVVNCTIHYQSYQLYGKPSAGHEIPHGLQDPSVHYRMYKSQLLNLALHQLTPVHTHWHATYWRTTAMLRGTTSFWSTFRAAYCLPIGSLSVRSKMANVGMDTDDMLRLTLTGKFAVGRQAGLYKCCSLWYW